MKDFIGYFTLYDIIGYLLPGIGVTIVCQTSLGVYRPGLAFSMP